MDTDWGFPTPKRKVNIQSTPALKVNDKILYEKESLVFLAKLQKQNNKEVTEVSQPNENNTPNTFDQLEMNNFSDSYSFINDKNPLLSKYEYISDNNIGPPPANNLNTVQSSNLSVSNEKKKFNDKNYQDYIQQRSNDPYINK